MLMRPYQIRMVHTRHGAHFSSSVVVAVPPCCTSIPMSHTLPEVYPERQRPLS